VTLNEPADEFELPLVSFALIVNALLPMLNPDELISPVQKSDETIFV